MDTIKLNNTIAFFISDLADFDKINKVLNKLSFECHDICITSDKDIGHNDYAIIPLFYLRFSNSDIVFFNIQSYLEHRDIFAPDRIILAMTANEYLSNNIDPRALSVKQVIDYEI